MTRDLPGNHTVSYSHLLFSSILHQEVDNDLTGFSPDDGDLVQVLELGELRT